MARNSRLFGKRSSAAVKRQGPGDGGCFDYPAGEAPEPDRDTDTAFEFYRAYSDITNQAATPDGFTQGFQNLMGLITLGFYDTNQCAKFRSQTQGCMGINIYIERDPTKDPGPSFPKPPSTANFKCTLFGPAVTA